MKNRFESTIEEARSIILSKEEKDIIRERLNTHISKTRVMESSPVRLQEYSPRKLSPLSTFIFNWKTTMPALILIVALLTGGVTYAAKDTLPGDSLYPIKINVNEKVQSTLAFGGEAKAKVEAKHAVNRLEEAEALAFKGSLDGETEAELQARFLDHANQAIEYIEKADADDADAILLAGDFEGQLRAHQYAAFSMSGNFALSEADAKAANQAGLTMTMTASKTKVTSVFVDAIGSARSRLEAASNTRLEASAKATFEAGGDINKIMEDARAAASSSIVDAEAYLKGDKIDAETRTRVQITIKEAKDFVAQAEVRLEAEAQSEALVLFKKAQKKAEEAKIEAESYLKIKVDIDAVVDDIDLSANASSGVEASQGSNTSASSSAQGNDTLLEVDSSLKSNLGL